MIVMIYRTYESGEPVLIPLRCEDGDELLAVTIGQVIETVRKLQGGGYERTSVTVQLLTVGDGVTTLGKFEIGQHHLPFARRTRSRRRPGEVQCGSKH